MSATASVTLQQRWTTDRATRIRLAIAICGALGLLLAQFLGEAVLPPIAVYLGALALVAGCLHFVSSGDERGFLLDLFFGSFVLRIVLVLAAHAILLGVGMDGYLFPDDRAYDEIGRDIARAWRGEIPGILQGDAYLVMNFTYLLALLYTAFGHSLLAAKVLVASFGSVTALAVYGITREIWGRPAARVTGVVTALVPSLLVWSLVNLKDMMVVMVIALAFWGLLVFARRGDWRGAVVTLASLALMQDLRLYVFILLGWLAIGGYLLASVGTIRARLVRGVPFALAVVAMMAFMESAEFGLQYVTSQKATRYEGVRDSGEAGSRLETGVVIDDDNFYRRQAIYLPTGIAYVLTAPLPWTVSRVQEAVLLPDVALWYLALIGAGVGVARAIRARLWAALPLAAYVVLLVTALALIENNVGTLVRHRAMLLPIVLVLAAPFLRRLYDRVSAWQVARSFSN